MQIHMYELYCTGSLPTVSAINLVCIFDHLSQICTPYSKSKNYYYITRTVYGRISPCSNTVFRLHCSMSNTSRVGPSRQLDQQGWRQPHESYQTVVILVWLLLKGSLPF